MNIKKRLSCILIFLLIFVFLFSGCALLSPAEEFSETAFLSFLEEQIENRQTEISYPCRKANDLEKQVDDVLGHAYERYLIGANVSNITWDIQSLIHSDVILELEYKDAYTDERESALDFSPELFADEVEKAVAARDSVHLIFFNDGTLTDEFLEAAIQSNVFESTSALVNYYLESGQYTISAYSDYAVVSLDFEYCENTVPYENLKIPTDLRDAAELLAEQWDTDDTAILYYPQGNDDPEMLCQVLFNTAFANDVDDPYVCGTCEWMVYGESDLILSIRKIYETDSEILAEKRRELLAEAETIAHNLQSETTEEKILEIGKLLASRICYDNKISNEISSENISEESNVNRSAYGALIGGNTVCSGYARAFKLICDFAGIDCWVVDGKVDGEGHEWNTVYYDDEMHYVDVTFADTGKMSKFYLFEKSLYEKEHYTIEENFYLPGADAA